MTTKYQETEQARNDRHHYRDGLKDGALIHDEFTVLLGDCQHVERMVGDDWPADAADKLQSARRRAKAFLSEAAKRGKGRERLPMSFFCDNCLLAIEGCECSAGPAISPKTKAEMDRPLPPRRHRFHYREGMWRGGIAYEDLDSAATSCFYIIEIVKEGWPEEATKHLRDNIDRMKFMLDQARKRVEDCNRLLLFAFCDDCDPGMDVCPCDASTT